MARRARGSLWLLRLSSTTTSPGLRVGTRLCSTQAVNVAALMGAVEDAGCHNLALTQAADEGQGLPMSVRNLGDERCPAHEPAPQAGHVGPDPGLVQEDEAFRRDPMLMNFPSVPEARHLGAVLFARHQSFF